MNDVTRILESIGRGEGAAADLWPLVYDELRRLAAGQMAGERPGHTLDTTALVHEAYLRLAADEPKAYANRRHFYAAAATAMRRILVDSARRKVSAKRGGELRREHLELEDVPAAERAAELLALHEALDRLAADDPERAKLVELRYFAGLTLEQAAECLDVSLSTAARSWRYARAWLHTAIAGDDSEKS